MSAVPAPAADAPIPAESPYIHPTPPFFTRLGRYIQLYILKFLVSLFFFITQRLQRTPQTQKPTKVKKYPVRPRLKNRIFIPHSHDGKTKLPLFIDIHGGGFCLMNPEVDDQFCSKLANDNNIVVVSINYGKGPRHRFPGPANDAFEIAQAVIEDSTLPIDKSRIVAGGFSAGGNLSLSMVQRKPLHDLIKGIVAFYPALDFTTSIASKLSTRPVTEKEDLLKSKGELFNFGYIADGQDRSDPLLSPFFGTRENFPPYLYLIGAEEDLLCREARDFAEKMAGVPAGQAGSNTIPGVAEKDGWEEGTVRWECIRKCEHSFTHIAQKGPKEEWRRKQYEEVVKRVGEWLMAGPFKA